MDQGQTRNFSIIAHVDHGKSTLADRFIQICGALTEREMSDQVLPPIDQEHARAVEAHMEKHGVPRHHLWPLERIRHRLYLCANRRHQIK